ncbi:MAG: hypothetical protein Q8P29_00835 [Candidatus Levybacteria bacterium]|nr:hypothetical protein [Candidatus Levybacteria bacterium]MDZ4227804.1 hypothetical protein [Candidatus Levybacteria bacterium]
MAEGADIEIQKIPEVDKVPAVEERESPDKPSVAEASPIKESKKKSKAIEDLENDPDIVEHVDSAKVEALVRKIGEFYNLPQLAIEQGLKSEIYILTNESFNGELESRGKGLNIEEQKELVEILAQKKSLSADEINKNLEEFNKRIEDKTEEKAKVAREHAEATGGVSISQKRGGSMIFIKENSTFEREQDEIHELLHAMSVGENGEYRGFDEGTFRISVPKCNGNLNEATTELLSLAIKYPNIASEELLNEINGGEIDVAYRPNVLKMLKMLHFTSQSKEPFTVKELAKYYFHDYQGKGYAVDLLRDKLREKIRPDLYREVEPWLLNDLEDVNRTKTV